ncbi:MAG: zinc ribbon domain-containing protein [Deltaproteobacteria bacterium]|nr:MAG: zinc ribbon domain-containing protein [Deltaproteobacteria bacterium]
MNTKTCPSCGAEVPTVAKRCRDCFHDFRPKSGGSSWSTAVLVLTGCVAIMAVLGAVTLGAITNFPLEEQLQVNKETRYVIATTQYVSGVRTSRVSFDEISHVEHLIVGNGNFEIRAHKQSGGYLTLARSKKSRKHDAENFANLMGKRFEETDNSPRGFNMQPAQ